MNYKKELDKHAKRRAKIYAMWANGDGKPVREIANVYGISTQRVRQIIDQEANPKRTAK